MSAKRKPYVLRWRDGVMDDPRLSWRAKVAAMPLVRHAGSDGKNCYPGRKRCAEEMSVGEATIARGWAELVETGWLVVQPLPQGRRRTQGAVKTLRFPSDFVSDGHEVDATSCPSGREPVSDGYATYSGNRASSASPPPRPTCGHCGGELVVLEDEEAAYCPKDGCYYSIPLGSRT